MPWRLALRKRASPCTSGALTNLKWLNPKFASVQLDAKFYAPNLAPKKEIKVKLTEYLSKSLVAVSSKIALDQTLAFLRLNFEPLELFPQASARMGHLTPVSHPSNVANQRQQSGPPVPDQQFDLGSWSQRTTSSWCAQKNWRARTLYHPFYIKDSTLDSAFTNERIVLYLVIWPDLFTEKSVVS